MARGRSLAGRVPRGVRPTGARVREALFDLVGHDLAGLTMLDAYGGTGLVGLEAWSRGASVTVCEKRPAVVSEIRRRSKDLGANLAIHRGDVLALLKGFEPFDGVFADPPYALDPLPICAKLGSIAKRWMVAEVQRGAVPPDTAGTLTFDRVRRYGDSELWVFRA
jgi:16S rRNA (guanine966-N2)-methyltransferase